MKCYESNSSKPFLLRTIVSGLFLSIPISLFSVLSVVLSVSASPDSCSEPSCEIASSETASELVNSPNLLSQIRPIEPQQLDDGERIILDEGSDGKLILEDGTVDIQLLNQTDSTIIFQLTTGDDPQTTMGIIDDTTIVSCLTKVLKGGWLHS